MKSRPVDENWEHDAYHHSTTITAVSSYRSGTGQTKHV